MNLYGISYRYKKSNKRHAIVFLVKDFTEAQDFVQNFIKDSIDPIDKRTIKEIGESSPLISSCEMLDYRYIDLEGLK